MIARAFASLLAQEYKPVELLVVDDGSTDGTRDAVASYGHRLQCLYLPNKERGVARDACLAASKGELIVSLDSHDVMLPGLLERLAMALSEEPEIGTADCRAEFFDEETGSPFDVFPRRPVQGDAILQSAIGNRIAIGSVIARRSLLDHVGWFDEDRDLAGVEDWELWTRCLAVGKVPFVDTIGVKIHFPANNRVGDPQRWTKRSGEPRAKIIDHPLNQVRLVAHRRKSEQRCGRG